MESKFKQHLHCRTLKTVNPKFPLPRFKWHVRAKYHITGFPTFEPIWGLQHPQHHWLRLCQPGREQCLFHCWHHVRWQRSFQITTTTSESNCKTKQQEEWPPSWQQLSSEVAYQAQQEPMMNWERPKTSVIYSRMHRQHGQLQWNKSTTTTQRQQSTTAAQRQQSTTAVQRQQSTMAVQRQQSTAYNQSATAPQKQPLDNSSSETTSRNQQLRETTRQQQRSRQPVDNSNPEITSRRQQLRDTQSTTAVQRQPMNKTNSDTTSQQQQRLAWQKSVNNDQFGNCHWRQQQAAQKQSVNNKQLRDSHSTADRSETTNRQQADQRQPLNSRQLWESQSTASSSASCSNLAVVRWQRSTQQRAVDNQQPSDNQLTTTTLTNNFAGPARMINSIVLRGCFQYNISWQAVLRACEAWGGVTINHWASFTLGQGATPTSTWKCALLMIEFNTHVAGQGDKSWDSCDQINQKTKNHLNFLWPKGAVWEPFLPSETSSKRHYFPRTEEHKLFFCGPKRVLGWGPQRPCRKLFLSLT